MDKILETKIIFDGKIVLKLLHVKVLLFVMFGYTNFKIAWLLGYSKKTVDSWLSNEQNGGLYPILGVFSRTAAGAWLKGQLPEFDLAQDELEKISNLELLYLIIANLEKKSDRHKLPFSELNLSCNPSKADYYLRGKELLSSAILFSSKKMWKEAGTYFNQAEEVFKPNELLGLITACFSFLTYVQLTEFEHAKSELTRIAETYLGSLYRGLEEIVPNRKDSTYPSQRSGQKVGRGGFSNISPDYKIRMNTESSKNLVWGRTK